MSAEVLEDVRTALRTRFAAVLSVNEKKDQVAWEGRAFKPVKGTAYWREWLAPGVRERQSIVPIRLELRGTYFIDVFDLPGRGNKAVLTKAASIIAAFSPDGLQLTAGSQVVTIGGFGQSPSIGRVLHSGDWAQAPITVPWSTNIYQPDL